MALDAAAAACQGSPSLQVSVATAAALQARPAVARPFTLQHMPRECATSPTGTSRQARALQPNRQHARGGLRVVCLLTRLSCVVPVPSCRRSLRKAWWQLVEDVQLAAEAAARQAEVHAWKTKGAAVKVGWGGVLYPPPAPRHSRVQLQLLEGPSACSALARFGVGATRCR